MWSGVVRCNPVVIGQRFALSLAAAKFCVVFANTTLSLVDLCLFSQVTLTSFSFLSNLHKQTISHRTFCDKTLRIA